MGKTIFWSWQSDLDARVTRNLIREALVQAIKALSVGLEEAERPGIDHDTRGVPGSPGIVETIHRKIDEAAVFVADVMIPPMLRIERCLWRRYPQFWPVRQSPPSDPRLAPRPALGVSS